MNDQPQPNENKEAEKYFRKLTTPPHLRVTVIPDDWGPDINEVNTMLDSLIEKWIAQGWDPITKTWSEENKKDSE